ncbi:MAG TPA: ABC transporter substrate-binding protein [Microbacterium sp.]|uniref:ABC transporter substrate-binding protein n=1 Tax=Microbacterium sp. TaxID=51671 RepID=UPI002B490CB6|nr:ABC transporter substrate-binding protein [Microbacterium sp.]HKT55462.1 ABC transporter substrate-binding protein [Microbacterium sp.]
MTQHLRSRMRIGLFAAPLVAGSLILAGCSGSSAASGPEPQTISFAFGATNDQDKAAYTALATGFEKTHKGVTVTPLNLPSESYPTALATRVQGGNAPDTFYAEGGTGQAHSIIPWAKSGLALGISDPSVIDALPASQKNLWVYNGKAYGVPLGTQVYGSIYNDDLAKSVGVDINASSTLDDVLSACSVARSHGKAVYALAGSQPANTGFLALTLAASTVYGSDANWNTQRAAGKTTFAGTPGWTTALESIKKMYDAGCFQDGATSAGFDAITNNASSGKVLGFFAPSGAAKEIMDAAGGHVKLVILPVPAPAGTKTYLAVSADQSVAASAKTKSPKLAAAFLKYILSPAGQENYAKSVGAIPVGATSSTPLLPQYQTVKDYIVSGTVRGYPSLDWPNPKVYTDLGSGVQGILTGQMTVKQVLQQMDSDWG